MSPVTRTSLTRTALGALAGLGLVAATTSVPAAAAQSAQVLDCAGHPVTVRINDNNSSERGGWASVQVLEGGSGHLTPVRFSGSLTDTTVGQVLGTFENVRGNGHVPRSRGVTRCTTSFDATVADFVENLEELPPGVSLEDAVTLEVNVFVTTR